LTYCSSDSPRAPGRAAEAKRGETAQRGLDIDEERQQEEPGHRWRGWRPRRDVTVEHVEFQDPGVVVGNPRVAEEYRSQDAARSVEQTGPVTFDLPVLQQVQADPVPVEAQAGVKVADDDHGMMNGRHGAKFSSGKDAADHDLASGRQGSRTRRTCRAGRSRHPQLAVIALNGVHSGKSK